MGVIQPGRKVVVALGGNALVRTGEEPTIATQSQNVEKAMRSLVPLVEARNKLVITHGNGFQVGNILIRVEEALGKAYGIPLEICVAESQGEIGYLIEQAMQNVLAAAGHRLPVLSLLTQVIVDARDRAFANPTKPVGPTYTARQARALEAKGLPVIYEKGRGWRRVVASPRPVEIDDVEVIDWLLRKPALVIAAGGGGVPVVRRRNGQLEGVPAVIDKDFASATLALGIRAPHMVILTGVRAVYRDFAEPGQKLLSTLSIEDAAAMVAAGQFPPGSMGPKIEAAIEFIRAGGRSVTITDTEHLNAALLGRDGTTLTRSGRLPQRRSR
ncbi:MAG: carbamate kinase [Deltaproteobacteria bacterium]|nr:carbamate kinase [Deltaproteobacteria bacterium]